MVTTITKRLVAAAPAGGKTIALEFTDGTTKVVDLTGLLNGPVYANIASNDEAFAELYFDPELGTVCWPGDVDIAPETLAALPDISTR